MANRGSRKAEPESHLELFRAWLGARASHPYYDVLCNGVFVNQVFVAGQPAGPPAGPPVNPLVLAQQALASAAFPRLSIHTDAPCP